MSDLIRRAREALVNVTPGPWVMETVRTSCGTCHRIGPFPRPAYASKPEGWACVYDDYPPGVGSPDLLANSRFIAAARDLVPAMAARLEAQEALLREAMAVLAKAQDQSCEGFCEQLPQADTYTPDMDLDCATCFLRPTLAKLRAHLDGRADEGGVSNGI